MILHICPMQAVRESGLPDTVTALSVELGRVSPATCEVGIKIHNYNNCDTLVDKIYVHEKSASEDALQLT